MRIAAAWWSFLGAAACLAACGSRTPLAEPAGEGGRAAVTGGDGGDPSGVTAHGSARSASSASATSASSAGTASGTNTASGTGGDGGSEPTPEPQCLCPDEPGFAECVLPFMCCPCAGTCEDPDTFNCSCEDPRSCVERDAPPPP